MVDNSTSSRPRIWVVYPMDCAMTRQGLRDGAVTPPYHHRSAREAWLAYAPGLSPDPARYLVAAGELTGEVDRRGAHAVLIDWATAIPAVVLMQPGAPHG